MKKYVRMFLTPLLLMGLLLPLTTSAEESVKIGISIPSADHGWTAGVVWWAKKAVEDWKQKDRAIEFFLVTADSPAKQIGDVEDLMVKGIDVLVILPHNSVPLTPVVEEVYKNGIYTVVVDRGLIKDAQHVYVAGDNPGMGRVSAEWMAKEMGGKGKMVVLEGRKIS
jgi:ribose transport system substrate-binding protein